MTNTNTSGDKYNVFDYIDIFAEDGYTLFQESLAAMDAEDPDGASNKAELVANIGEDLWGFFGCGAGLVLLNLLLKKDDMAMYNEIKQANLSAAMEVYPDMEDALADFYDFLYEHEDKDKEPDEELVMEYLTYWLASNFFDVEENEDFSEDQLDIAYITAGTFNDFVKQVLLIQNEKFGPYVKEIDDVYLSNMINLEDGDSPALN